MNIAKEMRILKWKLKRTKDEVRRLENKMKCLMGACSHKELDVTDYGTANCKICGKNFDWYCPTSPTWVCDYEQEDGSYDEDCCRYCGQPEERK